MGNALYVDKNLLCQFDKTKHVQVRTHPGGQDSRIYVNDQLSDYEYQADGWIYSRQTGKFVSDLSIDDFARNYL